MTTRGKLDATPTGVYFQTTQQPSHIIVNKDDKIKFITWALIYSLDQAIDDEITQHITTQIIYDDVMNYDVITGNKVISKLYGILDDMNIKYRKLFSNNDDM